MIVITGRGKSDKITFLIYDDNFELQFIRPYTPELDDPSIEGITDSRGKGRPTFRPFGITSDEDNIYIANHTKTGIYDINDYSFKGLLPIMSFFNTHQILKKDNIMYVANTYQNSIGIHNLDDGSSFFKILPAKSHCNSLFYSDDLYYVLHNRKLKPSEFYKGDTKIAECGKCCHNIIVDKDFYTIDTSKHELVINDERYFIHKGFNRGLQKTDNKLLVGNDDKNGTASVFIFNLDTRIFENRINIGLLDKITDIKCI
jgi:hypothetical protein